MKNNIIKSLLSVVLILSMCMGLFTTVGAENLTGKDIAEMEFDSASTELYEGVSLLMGLGILNETDTFPANLGEGITRAHFLEFVMRFAFDGAAGSTGKTLPFTDVDTTASYYPSLATAVEAGYIKEDTRFRPDDYITYEEALTVMFRVYDLDVLLDQSLPWPQNYVKLATKLKLYKGDMLLDHDGCLTYEGFFKLMGDVLEANVVEAHYSTEGIEYTISEQKYMELWYDTYEFEGVVKANGITNIDASGVYKENHLLIGDRYYYAGDKYQQYLGYSVEGFYRDDDFDTIISISKKYSKELEIEAKDIDGVSVSGDTVNIKYEDNGSYKDVQISKKANVLYNGKAFDPTYFNVDWYNIERGSIKLLARNGSTYDMAFIEEYESKIVVSVDTNEEGMIYVKDDEPVVLEDTDFYEIKKDGKVIALADIQPDNVISIKKSYDNSRLEIFVSEEKFTSPLTAKSVDEGILYFGNKQYKNVGSTLISSMKLGETYDVYVDVFGYIVECENVAEKDINVGYMIKLGYDDWKKKVEVMMLKAGDEEPFIYELAEKVKIDGKSYKISNIIDTAINDTSNCPLFSGNTEPCEFVIYRFNTDGKISYIDTPTLGANEDKKTTIYKKIDTDNYDNPLYTQAQIDKIKANGLYLKNDKFGYYYDAAFNVAGIPKSLIALNKNTMCVNIPEVTDDLGNVITTPYEDYETVSYSAVPDEDWHKSLVLYTLGSEGMVAIAGCFKGLGGGGSITDRDVMYVVARIAFAQKDDEWMRRITVVRNGVETNIYVKPEDEAKGKVTIPADLAVGDSISYKANTSGYVTAFSKYFDYKTQTIMNSSYFSSRIRIGGGYIYDWEGGFYSIVTDPDNFNAEYSEVLAKPSGGYIYEVSGKELIYEPMTDSKIVKFSSAGEGATIYISKLGYGTNRAFHYYKGQASDKDKYGELKATFYDSYGGNILSTTKADAYGKITIPSNTDHSLTQGNDMFVGWSDGKTVWTAGSQCTLTHHAYFYPVWESSYRHSFVSDSATATGTAPEDIWSIADGTKTITLPENPFTYIGWEFIGWTDGTNTYQPGAQYLVTENHVEFKAKWQEARTATFVAPSADYTGTAPVAISKLAGTPIQLPENTFTREVAVGNYEFQGWKLGTTTYQAGDSFTMPDNNVEFVAQFKYVGGTASMGVSKAASVERTTLDGGGYTYTATDRSTFNGAYNIINNSTEKKSRYALFEIDLTNIKNITSATIDLSASKVDNGGSLRFFAGSGNYDSDFANPALPTSYFASESVTNSSTLTDRTFTTDITEYLKSQAEAGKKKVTIFVYYTASRANWNGGFRLYWPGKTSFAPTLTITTANDQ